MTVTCGSHGRALALVHAEVDESCLHAIGERRGAAARIGEHEHPDGPGLAVAHDVELERLGRRSLTAQELGDRLDHGGRLRSEERQREVVAVERAPSSEVPISPAPELLRDLVRHVESEEQPDPVIAADGSGQPSRGCVTTLQQSADEVKRRRGRASADHLTVSRQLRANGAVPVGPHGVREHEADGLVRRAAARPCDTGHGDRDVGSEPSAGARPPSQLRPPARPRRAPR